MTIDQTVFQCINIRQVTRKVFKTSPCGGMWRNVKAWKTMFDPYTDTLDRFSDILTGYNICDFFFVFLHNKPFLMGSKFFPFRADPFSEGKQNNFDSYLPWKCNHSP